MCGEEEHEYCLHTSLSTAESLSSFIEAQKSNQAPFRHEASFVISSGKIDFDSTEVSEKIEFA
jgi:hypothetical protein